MDYVKNFSQYIKVDRKNDCYQKIQRKNIN